MSVEGPEDLADEVNNADRAKEVSASFDDKPSMPGKEHPVFSRLKNTEPHEDLDSIDLPTDLQSKWREYMHRGAMKFFGADSRMAIVDIAYGMYGFSANLFTSTDEDDFGGEQLP